MLRSTRWQVMMSFSPSFCLLNHGDSLLSVKPLWLSSMKSSGIQNSNSWKSWWQGFFFFFKGDKEEQKNSRSCILSPWSLAYSPNVGFLWFRMCWEKQEKLGFAFLILRIRLYRHENLMIQNLGSVDVYWKGQMINTLDFAGHLVSAAAIDGNCSNSMDMAVHQ
jgi:hypothetical protein